MKTLNHRMARRVLAPVCISFALAGCGLFGNQGSVASGMKYQSEGKPRAALIEAKKVLQRDDKNGKAWLLLGQSSLMLGDPASALNDLDKARANGVPRAEWVVPMGRALLVTRQYRKLLDTVKPDDAYKPAVQAQVYVLRGNARHALGSNDQAAQSYQAALKIRPDDPGALTGLAAIARQGGDSQEAQQYVHKAMTGAPENPEVWVAKGDLASAAGDPAGAVSAYRKALDLKASDWLPQKRFYARLRLAGTRIQQQQYEKALSNIEMMEKMAPKQPAPHYMHAVVLYRQGHLDDAVDQLQKVLEVSPNNVEAQLLMGAVNYARGNYGQAQMYLSNVMGMDAGNAQARKLLALTLYREGHSRQALETLKPVMAGKLSDAQMLALLQRTSVENRGGPSTAGSTGTKLPAAQELASSASVAAGSTASATAASRTRFADARQALAAGDADKAVRLLHAAKSDNGAAEAERHVLLVMAQVRAKHVSDAVKTAAAYAEKHPDDSAAHMLYGGALVAAGKSGQARTQYKKAQQLDPKNVMVLQNLANLDVQEKRYDDAKARYKAMLKLNPDNAFALTALGQLAALQGDKAEAIKQYQHAIDASPKSANGYMALVKLYVRQRQFDKAIATARKLMKADPQNPFGFNALGAAELGAGHHQEALEPLQKAVKLAPQVDLFRINLARAQVLDDDADSARKNLQHVLKSHPDAVSAVRLLAFLKLQDHDFPGAVALAQTLQKQSATRVQGLTLEGDLEMANKSWSKAAEVYGKGLKLHESRALVVKAFLALDKAGDESAGRVLRDWLAGHADDTAMRLQLAQYYFGRQKLSDAASQYEKVLKVYPSNVGALNNLAWIYIRQNNPQALSLAKKAHQLAPDSSSVQDTYGWALVNAGKPEAALPILSKAAKTSSKAPDIRYHLAVAQARSGDTSAARATLDQLNRSEPRFADKEAADALYRKLSASGADGGDARR